MLKKKQQKGGVPIFDRVKKGFIGMMSPVSTRKNNDDGTPSSPAQAVQTSVPSNNVTRDVKIGSGAGEGLTVNQIEIVCPADQLLKK